MINRPPILGEHNPYAEVDQVLGPWADEHAIRVFIAHRDDEVRSFDVRSPRNQKYHIWIDWPSKDGTITVRLWHRDDRGTVTFTGGLPELRKNLDLALGWATRGHPTGHSTRLPPPRWIQTLLRWLRLDKP